MKKIIALAFALVVFQGMAQMGQVWPLATRQEFEYDKDFKITKEYESTSYCSFIMFINNNEFIHATDNITSLYKILSRTTDGTFNTYRVASEVGNIYTFSFDATKKDIMIFSDKGYGIYYKTLAMYETKVFNNLSK
jgi:hypothetical protein